MARRAYRPPRLTLGGTVARPELPLGIWGRIRREEMGPNRFRARARFRDYDGHTRDVEAWADTAPAAERALRVKLRDRSVPGDDDINPDMRITRLSELWINEIVAEDRITPQTVNQYESSLRTSILPALGNLRIREATVGRLDRFLKTIATNRPAAAKSAKCVLGQMLSLAVRHGALPTNPVRDTGRLRKPRRTITALTAENLDAVRAAIRQWQTPLPGKPGPRHTSDLADVVDLMLGRTDRATPKGLRRHGTRAHGQPRRRADRPKIPSGGQALLRKGISKGQRVATCEDQ